MCSQYIKIYEGDKSFSCDNIIRRCRVENLDVVVFTVYLSCQRYNVPVPYLLPQKPSKTPLLIPLCFPLVRFFTGVCFLLGLCHHHNFA
jgi:hypothetical protein